jgi:myo-inositol-1(or 4)-monophosphatase
MARSALLNIMVGAALKAGRALARDFGEVENLQVSLKGPANFVSAADRRAEKVIVDELRKARPAYGFLTEETGEIPGTDKTHRWIVDPLDGTTNFLHGVPIFSVSIALERDGEVVAGVVYNPVMNELYAGEKGTGAFFNDRRLRVAARKELADALIATGIPHLGRPAQDRFLSELGALMKQVAGVRRCGSAALDLAWVAAGRFDGFWEHALSPWDVAAGILLVREAGGIVTDADGGDRALTGVSILAANPRLHGLLRTVLAGAQTG